MKNLRSKISSTVGCAGAKWNIWSNGEVMMSATTVGSRTTVFMPQASLQAITAATQEHLDLSMQPPLITSPSQRPTFLRGGDRHVKMPCLRRGGKCKGTPLSYPFPTHSNTSDNINICRTCKILVGLLVDIPHVTLVIISYSVCSFFRYLTYLLWLGTAQYHFSIILGHPPCRDSLGLSLWISPTR